MRATMACWAALLALLAATSVHGAAPAPAAAPAAAEPLGCTFMSIAQAEDLPDLQTWEFDLQLPANKLAASQAELVAQASADLQARMRTSASKAQHPAPAQRIMLPPALLRTLAYCLQLVGNNCQCVAVPLPQGLGLEPDATQAETKAQTWTTYFLLDAEAEGESALGSGAGSLTPFDSPGTLRQASGARCACCACHACTCACLPRLQHSPWSSGDAVVLTPQCARPTPPKQVPQEHWGTQEEGQPAAA